MQSYIFINGSCLETTQSKIPDENLLLRRYLGPELDIGPDMTANIMKNNGEVVHRSTYAALTESEAPNLAQISRRETFDKKKTVKLVPDVSPDDLPEINLEYTPLYDLYEDAHMDSKGQPVGPEDEEPPTAATGLDTEVTTPESDDNYVNNSIMLPRGSKFSRGRVIGWKRDTYGKLTVRANTNPILDSREYQAEFSDGEVSELTANGITKYMYASCDDEVNGYLLMDSLVEYRKNDKAMSVADQRSVLYGRQVMRKSTAGLQICV